MKLLRVIPSMLPEAGGTATAVRETSDLMRARGVEVTVLTLDPADDPEAGAIGLGPGKGFYGYSPRFRDWLRAHVKEVDLILVEGCWQYPGLAVWQEARRAGVPYAVFPHGMLDPWFKRRYPLKHLKKWLYWPWAEYRVLRDAQAVFFTTEQECALARESFWLYRVREQIAPFGIAPPRIDSGEAKAAFAAAHPQSAAAPFLLFLGRIYEKKGVDLLLDAFAKLEPASGLRLVLAGPAQDPVFRRQVESAIGSGRVDWIPMLGGAAKWGALAAAEALILPSHQENFGLVIPEALAMGTPVLTTHPVNIAPLVESSGAGLVEADTADGVGRLLESWCGLPKEARARMRNAARPAFEAHFNLEKGIDVLIESLRATATKPASIPA